MKFIHSNKKYIERTMYPINPYMNGNKSQSPAILNDGNTAVWFTPCDATTVIKNISNYVSQVNDISGNNRHLLQANLSNQPIWSVNGILFDGIDDFMKCNSFQLVRPEMIYFVFKQKNTLIKNQDSYFDGNSALTMNIYYTDGPVLYAFNGSYNGPGVHNFDPAIDTVNILRILFNDSNTIFNSFIQQNSDIKHYGISNLVDANGFILGCRGNGSQPSNIEVQEIIIRKIADSTQNENAIYNYLKSKYSL